MELVTFTLKQIIVLQETKPLSCVLLVSPCLAVSVAPLISVLYHLIYISVGSAFWFLLLKKIVATLTKKLSSAITYTGQAESYVKYFFKSSKNIRNVSNGLSKSLDLLTCRKMAYAISGVTKWRIQALLAAASYILRDL